MFFHRKQNINPVFSFCLFPLSPICVFNNIKKKKKEEAKNLFRIISEVDKCVEISQCSLSTNLWIFTITSASLWKECVFCNQHNKYKISFLCRCLSVIWPYSHGLAWRLYQSPLSEREILPARCLCAVAERAQQIAKPMHIFINLTTRTQNLLCKTFDIQLPAALKCVFSSCVRVKLTVTRLLLCWNQT